MAADSGSSQPDLEFYPQYCFHLSPTIGRWCHLQATDIAALTFNPGFEGQDVYFYLNHPIKWARIAGVVVAIQEFSHRIIYTIDDSSGATIECVVATPPQFPAVTNCKTPKNPDLSADGNPLPKTDGPIDVGHIIDIKGGISVFRDVRQIRAERVTHLRTTEQETAFWEKIALLRKEVLCRPWVLDPREVSKLRREEEGRERKKKRTGLERESKRRKLEDDAAVRGEDGERTLLSKKTGLERRSAKSDGVVAAEVVRDGHHSHHHHHRTGLERRTTTRAVVHEEEPGSPDRRRRKTGLEPRRPSVGDSGRPAARFRQPLERPDLDETMSSSHIQLKTGLERRIAGSKTQESVSSSHQPRPTGLEESSVVETVDDATPSTTRPTGLEKRSSKKVQHGPAASAVHKTGLEKSSKLELAEDTTLRTTRSTGLEKRGSRSIEVEPTSSLRPQKTGLERKSSSRRQELTGDVTTVSYSARLRTGLEATTRQQTESGHKSARHRSTGLEPRKQRQLSSDPSRPRITGLERQSSRKALMEKSSQNSQPDQQLQGEEKCEPKITTLRSSGIKRPDSPVLVRGKGRLTGLERVTKPITRNSPVIGKYDSMGR